LKSKDDGDGEIFLRSAELRTNEQLVSQFAIAARLAVSRGETPTAFRV
jgi:hypothetical protein